MARKNPKTATDAVNENGTTTENTLTVVHNANEVTTVQPVIEQTQKQFKTLAEIASKAEKLSAVIQKIEVMNRAIKDLDSFKLGTGKLKDLLTITDGNGNRFDTTNSVVINDVMECLKISFNKRYDELEQEALLLEAA